MFSLSFLDVYNLIIVGSKAMANFTAIYESMLPPVNLTDSQPATTDENVMM